MKIIRLSSGFYQATCMLIRLRLILLALCIASPATMRAQEFFIAYDSLALPGYNILPTDMGGVIVHNYIVSQALPNTPQLSLYQLDKSGDIDWAHVYHTRLPNDSKGALKPLTPETLRTGSDGSILGAGGVALAPFSQTPVITKFSPEGNPIWSRTISPENENGWLEDVQELSSGEVLVTGLFLRESLLLKNNVAIESDNRFRHNGRRVQFIGDFLAGITGDGKISWVRGMEYDQGTLDQRFLFIQGGKPGLAGIVEYEDRDTNEPLLLLSLGKEGTIESSEALYANPTQTDGRLTSLHPHGIYSGGTYSIIYGTFSERVPKEIDPAEPFTQRLYDKQQQGFLIKIDEKNHIVWSKTVRPYRLLNKFSLTVLPANGDIVLTSSDRNTPAMMIRLNSTGDLLESTFLAESMGTYPTTDKQPIPNPLDHYTINGITATAPGNICGLCVLNKQVDNEDPETIVYYRSAVFQVAPDQGFYCGNPKPISTEVADFEIRRGAFPVRSVPITTYRESALSIEAEDIQIRQRNLCGAH